MSFSISLETYEPGKDYLLISYEGEVNKKVIAKYAPRVALAMQHRDCYKLLEDYRKTIIKKDAAEISEIQTFQMEYLAEKGIPFTQIKRALVMDESLVTNQDMDFFASLSVNKGQQVKVFTDMYLAIKWLSTD